MEKSHSGLEEAITLIDAKASEMGLDFFETEFEIVDEDLMAQIHAYILPVRFQHWTFGKQYQRIKTLAKYGYGGLAYETVINSNPAYSFLLSNNTLTEMKLVVAHVFAHVDFMANNGLFQGINRRQVADCAVNAQRINEIADEHGVEVVERWIDSCLTLVPQIDFSAKHRRGRPEWWMRGYEPDGELPDPVELEDEFDFLFSTENLRGLEQKQGKMEREKPILEHDLLYFLMNNRFADLDHWQRDVMGIIHEEWMYFQPNIRTKIMNEGWATFWHRRIIEELDQEIDFLTEDGEDQYLLYDRMNAQVISPGGQGGLNPYYLGINLWQRVFDRWENPSIQDREQFGLVGGEGMQKMFEVRSSMNDAEFVRNFCDEQLVTDLDAFCYQKTGPDWTIVSTDWTDVRDALFASLITGRNTPIISVIDDDYRHNRELLLFHRYEGLPLSEEDTRETLGHVHKMWGRSVHLITVDDMTLEVGISEDTPPSKKLVPSEKIQVSFSHDGAGSEISYFPGKPHRDPEKFAENYFLMKSKSREVRRRQNQLQ